jgi:hypothetical protein
MGQTYSRKEACILVLKACEDGDIENAQQFLANYTDIQNDLYTDYNASIEKQNLYSRQKYVRNIALILACDSNQANVKTIKWIIENLSPAPITYDEAFQIICKRGDVDIAKELIHKGFINVNNGLTECCTNGHTKLAKLIVEEYKNIDINAYESQAFRFACEKQQVETARYLGSIGADPTGSMNQALTMCGHHGNIEIANLVVELMEKRGVNVSNVFEIYGTGMLYWTCLRNHVDMFHWIREKGVDVNALYSGTTLKSVAQHNSVDLYTWFCDNYH